MIKKTWAFWKPIVTKKDGSINITQLKKELSDFSFILDQLPLIYCHITGNSLSKTMYNAQTVINCADDHYRSVYIHAIGQMIDSLKKDKLISKKAADTILNNLDSYI